LDIDSTFTGDLGLALQNSLGYYEYRQRELKVNITTLNICADVDASGGGSGRMLINLQAVANTTNVYSTGNPKEAGIKALLLRGTSITALNVWKGSVGVAAFPGDAATITTVNVGSRENPASDVDLLLTNNCTLTTINQYGGVLEVDAAVTTWTIGKGDGRIRGTGAIATLTLEEGAGTIFHESSGTITTLNVGPGVTVDCSRVKTAFTVTTTNIYPGGSIIDPSKRITFTNPLTLVRHGLKTAVEAGLDLGSNINIQRS
jgi:hypothetical protein